MTSALRLIMRSSKTRLKTSSVASAVWHLANLLQPDVANILLFNFCEQKFVQHGAITIAIDCNGLSLLIFKEKWPNYASTEIRTKQWLVLGASAFQCIRADFLYPKCDNFAWLHTRQDQNELHLKRWFFFAKSASSVIRSQAHLAAVCHVVPSCWNVANILLYNFWWT